MVLYDSVGLETMEQVSDFARKKQVQLVFDKIHGNYREKNFDNSLDKDH